MVMLLVACAAFIGVGYGAVAPTTVLTEKVGTTTTALQALGNHLTATSTRVTEVAASALMLQNSSQSLVEAMEWANENAGASFTTGLDNARLTATLVGQSSKSLNTSTEVVSRVAKPLSEMDNVLENPSVSLYSQYVPLGATAAFATIVVILGISLLPFCECCKHIHRTLTVLGVLFNALLWILAATLLIVGIVMSDVCVDAPRAAQSAAAAFETESPPVLVPSVQFYTQCNPAFVNDPIGVNMTNTPVQRVRDAKTALDAAEPAVRAINTQVVAGDFDSYAAVKSAAESLVVDFGSVSRATLGLQGSLECEGVQPLYSSIVSNVCAGFLDEGLVLFWALEVGAACMMVLVLLFNLTPLVQHPGVREADGEEAYVPGRLPANVVSPVQNATVMHGGALAKPNYDPKAEYDPDAGAIANHYDAERVAPRHGRRG